MELRRDRIEAENLGEYARKTAVLLRNKGWEAMVRALRMDSDLSSQVQHLPHPAAHLLDHLRRHGAPVVMRTAPWSRARLDEAVRRGSHLSAWQHLGFLEEEMKTMIHKGQWMILEYQEVAHLPNLRLSPLGVVPQRDRRPRTIVDYTYSGVNEEMVPLTGHLPLQFGRALHRLLRRIVGCDPSLGPVYIIKLDIADGFYRIHLAPWHIPLLGVAFPTPASDNPLIAFPLALPMGWTSSPPLFCAATETITDLTNAALARNDIAPPHRLEAAADANTCQNVLPLHQSGTNEGTRKEQKVVGTAWADVFVDDHLAFAQGSPGHLANVRRHLLHNIDRVFRPVELTDHHTRQEPVSLKKLATGDGHWSTTKTVLGWDLDTRNMTLALPTHQATRLLDILAEVPRIRSRISTRRWHQLLGELRSMVLALPGSRGLFSTLQEAFRHPETGRRLRLSQATHDFLDDFRWLAHDMARRPTRLRELVPGPPAYIGSCDASGAGMGGTWFPPGKTEPALVWRSKFADSIRQDLISAANPTGTLTNSDLELVGALAHQDVLAACTDIAETTQALLNDNQAAIHWLRRGSVTSTGAVAYLLRLQALHQRHHRYTMTYDHIPGHLNTMADDCSRLWHLDDAQLLTHFCLHYPQEGGWKLCQLSSKTQSALTSALRQRRPAPESYLPEPLPRTATGHCGQPSAQTFASTHTCLNTPLTRYSSSGSSPSVTAMAPLHHVANRCSLAQWRTPSALWARHWPYWGPQTHVLTT